MLAARTEDANFSLPTQKVGRKLWSRLEHSTDLKPKAHGKDLAKDLLAMDML